MHTLSPAESPERLAIPPTDAASLAGAVGRGGGGLRAREGEGGARALSPPPEILGPLVFTLSEPLVATALGLPARTVVSARVKKLARGRDWELMGETAVLAEKSLPLLIAALGLVLTPAELRALAEKSRRPELPTTIAAQVARRWPHNPTLLPVQWREGELPRSAHLVVARRAEFRPGQAVSIRLNPDTQRYELAQRPQRKGRP
jgi:hypothetical protein